MPAADEPQVLELRWPAIAPELEVMSFTPGRRAVTARKDAVLVPCDECPPRGRRHRSACVGDLPFQLAQAGDPDDRRVAGHPSHRLGRNRATALQPAGRRAGNPGQGVEIYLDDQLRPRAGAIGASATRMGGAAAAAQLDQGVVGPLPGRPLVILGRLQVALHGRSDGGGRLGDQLAIDPGEAVDRLANLQVAALMRPVALGQSGVGVYPVLEIFGDGNELSGIMLSAALSRLTSALRTAEAPTCSAVRAMATACW